MRFNPPLIAGTLLKRYKRFLADVELASGERITAHCANTGAMTGLKEPGIRVLLSKSTNPKRKLAYSWELAESKDNSGNCWVGVHTGRTNLLVREALEKQQIPQLQGFDTLKQEITLEDRTRLDFRITYPDNSHCYLEVKSVTLRQGDAARFPDAVSTRAKRHLEALQKKVAQGDRGMILFVVERPDCRYFEPAAEIDPDYTTALKKAVQSGVKILAWFCQTQPDEIILHSPLPLELKSQ